MAGKLKIKAIVIGSVIDIVGSLVFGAIFSIVMGVLHAMNGKDISSFERDFYSNVPAMTFGLIIGLLFTVLGGYCSARIAKENEKINAASVGVVGFITCLPFIGSLPLWYNAASLILVIPAAYLGGMIALFRKNKIVATPPKINMCN
jgi:hypothetical protein